jgi:DNA-binding FadR family transcriptional regulator
VSSVVVGPQGASDVDAADSSPAAAARATARPPSRAWRTALENIEARLLGGELRPGDHLPPERQLAAELGVARSSVREAVRVLEVLGLVRTGTGSGPNAGAIIVSSPDGGLSAVMRLHVAAQGFPVADVVEARLVVEPAIAAHLARAVAAARTEAHGELHVTEHTSVGDSDPAAAATPGVPDLARASALLDAMDADGLTPAEFLALDARFHVSLAEASGNTVLSATMAGLRDSIESYVLQAVPSLPPWHETSARLRAEHRAIVRAVSHGDATGAARLVHAHVAGYWRLRGGRIEPARSADPTEPTEPVEPHVANSTANPPTQVHPRHRRNR